MLFIVLFIGFRSINGKVFQDMAGYNDNYNAIIQCRLEAINAHNFIFDVLFVFLALRFLW